MKIARLKFASPVKAPGGRELLTSYDATRLPGVAAEVVGPLVVRLSQVVDGKKHAIEGQCEWVEYAPEEVKK